MPHRNVRFNCKQTGERIALLVGELTAETVLAHEGLTLSRRHLTQVAEGAGYKPPPILRETAILIERAAKLLPLWRSEMFYRFVMFQYATALLRRHVVELGKTVPHGLLGLRRKVAEAGLILERTLLICKGEVAMAVHPLGQMLLILLRADTLLRPWRGPRCVHRRMPRLPCPAHECRLGRNHRRCRRQQQGSESWS